ncbi:hypothetical protein MTO96_011428 [Rhipicephalus appendiculatus]
MAVNSEHSGNPPKTSKTLSLLCHLPTHSQQNCSPIWQRSWMLHGSISNMLGVPRGSTTTSDAEPLHCRKATLSCGKPTYSVTLQEGSPRSWHQGPFRICRRVGPNTFKLVDPQTGRACGEAHADQLAKYHGQRGA